MRHPTIRAITNTSDWEPLSLLAGTDLSTGVVHASVEKRHRSREFIAFLKRLDAAYAPATAIKIILDNHSAHISKETKAWLAQQPDGRFTFVFTPKHGSWLNLVEGFFSKLAAPRFATSEWLRWRNCVNESWPPSISPTANPSSTLGPTKSMRRRDMSRFMEALN
jgi:transposase